MKPPLQLDVKLKSLVDTDRAIFFEVVLRDLKIHTHRQLGYATPINPVWTIFFNSPINRDPFYSIFVNQKLNEYNLGKRN